MHHFYEFFSGGGMVRCGLGTEWNCLFANDFDEKKNRTYLENFPGSDELLSNKSIELLSVEDLPERADLAWASFPCQDLSLAGSGAGLGGERSGTFWSFWNLMKGLAAEQREPRIIALENVCGTLTSHGGQDFGSICQAFTEANYSVGAVVVDGAYFVPQSRPRLFVFGVHRDLSIPDSLRGTDQVEPWHPSHLVTAYHRLAELSKRAWVWWKLPEAPIRTITFSDLIEDEPTSVRWNNEAETRRLLSMMSPLNREKVTKATTTGKVMVGGLYKRIRKDQSGNRTQRAEVRFDDLAGCLRTPTGGSSRQAVLIVEGQKLRSRLLSTREAARLMGLPETYKLPQNYNEAYHLVGDGVVVPAVRFLAAHLLEPLLRINTVQEKEAA